MNLSRLFIGGYQEIKRPRNVIDEALMRRMQEASRRLRSEGIDLTPAIGPRHKRVRPQPKGVAPFLRSTVWPAEAANEPGASFDQAGTASNG